MREFSRRDLGWLFPVLAAGRAAAAEGQLKSSIYAHQDLDAGAGRRTHPILEGDNHTGVPIELHITELAPGQAPHPAHHHVHEEMVMIFEGTLEVTIGDRTAQLGPGSAAFVASNEHHGWRNVGNGMAKYFVLALGRDTA